MNTQENISLINYVVSGDGTPVILIHGMAASLHDWEALVPELASAGYRAYAVDLLGHGGSAKPTDPELYHSRAIYAALDYWIDSLGLEQPLILVGHSLGGYLSLKYALRHPQKVRAQVLIGPFFTPKQLSPLVRLLYRRPTLGEKALEFIPQWLIQTVVGMDLTSGPNITRQARRQIAADLKRASPHILNIPRTIPDMTPKLSQVDVPTLVIWGEKDQTLDPVFYSKLVDSLPNAMGQAIQGCGHQPHIGKPRLVNPIVLKFLADLPVDVPVASR